MNQDKNKINRRDAILGLATIPVAGAFLLGASAKSRHDEAIKNDILKELNVEAAAPPETGEFEVRVNRPEGASQFDQGTARQRVEVQTCAFPDGDLLDKGIDRTLDGC